MSPRPVHAIRKSARIVMGGRRGTLGGSERMGAYIETALDREGWDVEWLCPQDLPKTRESRRFPLLNEAIRTVAMARVLRSLPPAGLTVSHGMYGLGTVGPRLHVYHGTYAGLAEACREGLSRLDYLVLRRINGAFERWSGIGSTRIAVSRKAAGEVRTNYGLGCPRVIHNAVDGDHFVPREWPTRGRQWFGLPEGKPLVLIVGRLDFGKGREVLRRMLPSIPPEFKLVAAAPEHRGLETFPADRIDVLPGVSYEDLPALYSACDLLLCVSLYEGFGLTLTEAWGCGRPVVSGCVGIVEELRGSTDAFDSCVTDVGDARGLAVRVRRVVEDPALKREQGEWGRSLVDTRFDLRRLCSDYCDAVRTALDKGA